MVKKKTVLDLLDGMPDEIDLDDLFDALYLVHKIEKAEADVAAGNVIPHAEVERLTRQWRK